LASSEESRPGALEIERHGGASREVDLKTAFREDHGDVGRCTGRQLDADLRGVGSR
jgi:hypothetical protein